MKQLFFGILLFSVRFVSYAQDIPQLGAEIYLEPGQTTEQVKDWVKTMFEMKMPIIRVGLKIEIPGFSGSATARANYLKNETSDAFKDINGNPSFWSGNSLTIEAGETFVIKWTK